MSKKITINHNALQVVDTVTDGVDLMKPKRNRWYSETALQAGNIHFYPVINSEYPSARDAYTVPLADTVNADSVAFTANSFRAFCAANLGA